MMEIKKNIVALLIAGFVGGIVALMLIGSNSSSPSINTSGQTARLAALESSLKNLEDKTRYIEAMNDSQWKYIEFINDKAILSTSGTGFGTVFTKMGTFYIQLLDTKKYADGYKLRINIGNPNFQRIEDYAVEIEWGNNAFSDTKKTKNYSILNTPLIAGKWTAVDLIISPAKEEDIAYIGAKLFPDKIVLLK